MFKTIRKGAEALQVLAQDLRRIRVILTETLEVSQQREALEERLAKVERGYAGWSAQAEALVLKADALFKNARNAEERTRSMREKVDEGLDPLGAEVEEGPETPRDVLPPGYAPGSEEEGLLPVRVDVAPDYKALALRHKFG